MIFQTLLERPKPFITIARSVSLGVDGEYYPLDQWEGSKTLVESSVGGMSIELSLSVYPASFGPVRGKKKPSRFSAQLRMKHYHFTYTKVFLKGISRCRSLKRLSQALSEVDFREAILSVQKKFYDRSRVRSMYRLMGTTWEPFCSTFDPWGILDEVPFGQYLVVEQNLDTELKVRRYERSYLAQFSGPFKDPVPLEVVDWLTATALSPKLLPDTLHP